MQQKCVEQKAQDFPYDPEYKKLIVSRIIGFKEQMPGSGQWRLLKEREEECWHCDQWIYSLIFWDAKNIGKAAKSQTHNKIVNQMRKKVEELNPELNRNGSLLSLSVNDLDPSSGETSESIDGEEFSSNKKNIRSSLFKGKNQSGMGGTTTLEAPQLFGDFTNWKGVPMMRLEDFIMLLAKKYGHKNESLQVDFKVVLADMRKQLN